MGERKHAVQQNDRQRQGADNQYRPLLVPAQVGQRHLRKLPAVGGILTLLSASGTVGIADCLHRRNLRRNASRLSGGYPDRKERKYRRADENQRMNGYRHIISRKRGHGHHLRQDSLSDQITENQSERNPHDAKPQRLTADDLLDLPSRGADGLQQTVIVNIPDDGNLKNVINDQVASQNNEQKSSHDSSDGHRVRLGASRYVRPVCIARHIIGTGFVRGIAGILDDFVKLLLNGK